MILNGIVLIFLICFYLYLVHKETNKNAKIISVLVLLFYIVMIIYFMKVIYF